MESITSARVTEEEEVTQPTMAMLQQDTLTLVSTATPTPMVVAPTHTPMTMSTTTAMVMDTHTDRELVPMSTPVRSTLTPG